MKLQFIEQVRLEQRIAFITAIVRRLDDLGLLVEEAREEGAGRIAKRVVGITDLDEVEEWAVINATISLVGKVAQSAAVVSSGVLTPTLTNVAERTRRLTAKVRSNERRRYTPTTPATPAALITREEVKADE